MKPASLLLLLLSLFGQSAPAGQDEAIVAEGLISAPVAAVWAAWTTSAGLQSWLAPHADIDLKIDGLMRSNYDPKGHLGDPGTIENRVLAYERQRMLALRVSKAPEKFPFRTRVGDMWTVLYFEPTSDGKTHLRVVGLGFGGDAESVKMKEFFRQGNAYTLTELQKHFAP